MAGINVPGFEIFKEQIMESLVWNNKEIVMQKVAKKIGTEVVKELCVYHLMKNHHRI